MTTGAEGNSLSIILQAYGNPDNIIYTWTKDGLPINQKSSTQSIGDRISFDDSSLNITKLSRHDAGLYVCEAVNSQGAATLNVTVNVEYGASIKAISENVTVKPDEDAKLWCSFEGNPLTEENIEWHREGYDFSAKTDTSFNHNGSVSYLHIKKASREDVGHFQCTANNGISDKVSRDVMLVVNFKPEMDISPNLLKFASSHDSPGILKCRSKAAPMPNYTWSKGGSTLPVNTTGKYFTEVNKLDAITYESVLILSTVSSSDYGQYECAAKNEMGFATHSVKLEGVGPPDLVDSLDVANVTHNSVTLAWRPGFDGGKQTSYKIRYRKLDDKGYKYEDVIPTNSTSFTIYGLDVATDYIFSIMAINSLGQSKYRPDTTKTTTLSASPIGELTEIPGILLEKADLPKTVIVYVSITAAVLVIINVALVACFILRKRAKRLKDEADQASKSGGAIEMYAPSSYNDTMTRETLSYVSEKSETYSNDGDEDNNHPMNPMLGSPPIPDIPGFSGAMLNQNMSPYHGHEPPMIADYPPPNYVPYDVTMHARTLPHQHTHNIGGQHGVHFVDKPNCMVHTLNRSTGKQSFTAAPSPMPPLDGSYYNMSSERYLSYPPMMNDCGPQNMLDGIPIPPHPYGPPIPAPPVMPIQNKMLPGNSPNQLNGSPSQMGNVNGTPPPNYIPQEIQVSPIYVERPGGTLRRRDKMAAIPITPSMHRQVPPPDVTVLHPNQPPKKVEKLPPSILKDSSRHMPNTYNGYQTNSAPTSNQILMVQNLDSNQLHTNMPQYGTIKKDSKKNSATSTSPEMTTSNETHMM